MVEAMQPSSSRAGMTTESRESGRAGEVSGRLGIFAFPNGETGGAGQVGLIFVKGEFAGGDGKREEAAHKAMVEEPQGEGWEYFQNDGDCARGEVYPRRLQRRRSRGHFGQ